MKREEYHKINSQQSTVNKLESFITLTLLPKSLSQDTKKRIIKP